MKEYADDRALRATIREAQKGDEGAFERLVKELQEPVYRLALSMLRHREDAEDAAQETLIKLWRTLPDYRFECPLLPYVLRMTRTTVLDLERRRRGQRAMETSLTYETEEDEAAVRDIADVDVATDPVRALERKMTAQAVRAAIDELDEDAREIIILKDLQGLSYEQLCEVLGLEMGTVKSRLFRARKNLKKILKNGNIF